MGPAHQALSVGCADSSPRGRAKSVEPAALDGAAWREHLRNGQNPRSPPAAGVLPIGGKEVS